MDKDEEEGSHMKKMKKWLCIALAILIAGTCAQPVSASSAGGAAVSSKEVRAGDSEADEVRSGAEGVQGDIALISGGAKAAAKTPVEKYGRLSVKNGRLIGEDGKTVQLKGVSSHGLAWFPEFINEKSIKYMRDNWGIDVIRLAMYTAEGNGYCTGDDANRKRLREKIYEAADAAEKLGVYVIIDWHILSDGNPATYKSQAKSFFKTMAKRYADSDNVIYEICNEPNGGTTWEQIKAYAKPVIKAIRKYDKDGIVIVGTPNWSQDVDKAAASPLKGKNLMYALHFYAATHKDDLRSKLKAAEDKGLPVFVTEYGICDASGNGAIDKAEAAKWMDLLDKYKISSCIWNLSDKGEASAIIREGSGKTTGWKSSDLSDSGKWFVGMMKGK